MPSRVLGDWGHVEFEPEDCGDTVGATVDEDVKERIVSLVEEVENDRMVVVGSTVTIEEVD